MTDFLTRWKRALLSSEKRRCSLRCRCKWRMPSWLRPPLPRF